jgi:hypothetical protein
VSLDLVEIFTFCYLIIYCTLLRTDFVLTMCRNLQNLTKIIVQRRCDVGFVLAIRTQHIHACKVNQCSARSRGFSPAGWVRIHILHYPASALAAV